MKKLLAFAVIAATFASCANNDTKTVDETSTKDTTTVVVPVAPDSTMVVTDSTVKTTVVIDSIKK